jgi:hypothetical protein
MSIVVDLPAPFGPSSATVSPAATETSDPANCGDDAVRDPVRLLDSYEFDSLVHAVMVLLRGGLR